MSEEQLSALLVRTAEFQQTVLAHVGDLTVEGARYQVAFRAGLLSLEHAAAALVLVKHGLLASAYALMRPQYECLVRGIWLLHAANDAWIMKLSKPLTLEAARQANEGPMLAEMLKQLENCSNSPAGIVQQLKEYRDIAWKAMNSHTHGGLHPIARTLVGYPAQLTCDVMRNSNAVVALTAQLASILSGDHRNMDTVRRFHTEFADCIR